MLANIELVFDMQTETHTIQPGIVGFPRLFDTFAELMNVTELVYNIYIRVFAAIA